MQTIFKTGKYQCIEMSLVVASLIWLNKVNGHCNISNVFYNDRSRMLSSLVSRTILSHQEICRQQFEMVSLKKQNLFNYKQFDL